MALRHRSTATWVAHGTSEEMREKAWLDHSAPEYFAEQLGVGAFLGRYLRAADTKGPLMHYPNLECCEKQ